MLILQGVRSLPFLKGIVCGERVFVLRKLPHLVANRLPEKMHIHLQSALEILQRCLSSCSSRCFWSKYW